MTWVVYRRDADRRRTGVVEFRDLTVTLRLNEGASGEIVAYDGDSAGVRVGDGIIVARDSRTVVSGIVTRRERTVTADDDTTRLEFVDDTRRLAWRLTYPDPTRDADDAQPDYDRRDGPVDDVIAEYVDANAGESALDYRRIPGLVVAEPDGFGSDVRGKARWRDLVEFCSSLAARCDTCAFRAVQRLGSSDITFESWARQDRPGARFDLDGLRGSGAVVEHVYDTEFPEATTAIAGGRGELEDRTIVVRRDGDRETLWGRVESWLDQNNAGADDDPDDELEALEDAADDALRDGRAAINLSVDAVATDAVRWPDDYDVGDRVRVRVEGEWLWRTVYAVEVNVSARGETIEPRFGDASRRAVARILRRIGELRRDVDQRAKG